MSARKHLFQLPLLLAGVPALWEETLRQAGVPVSPFRKGAAVLSQLGQAAGRFVLFDSRSASSRLDAESARASQQIAIDVTTLGVAADSSKRAAGRRALASFLETDAGPAGKGEFLRRLKQELEELGGVWLRVADYPFPYKCAFLSGDGGPDSAIAHLQEAGLDLEPNAEAAELSAEALRLRYEAGLPTLLGTANSADGGIAASTATAVASDEFPLAWQTTTEEFTRWWHLRQKLTVRVDGRGPRYRIHTTGKPKGIRPALELWRGNHVAAFAVTERVVEVNAEGLAFLREEHRHPGGLIAGAVIRPLPARTIKGVRRQSA